MFACFLQRGKKEEDGPFDRGLVEKKVSSFG